MTEIPTIYTDIAKGELRHVLTGLAGLLLAHGVLGAGQGAAFVEIASALAVWIATAAWSAYQKVRAKQLLNVALATPKARTEAAVTQQLALGMNVPSVLTPPTVVPIAVVK